MANKHLTSKDKEITWAAIKKEGVDMVHEIDSEQLNKISESALSEIE